MNEKERIAWVELMVKAMELPLWQEELMMTVGKMKNPIVTINRLGMRVMIDRGDDDEHDTDSENME